MESEITKNKPGMLGQRNTLGNRESFCTLVFGNDRIKAKLQRL